MTPKVPRGLGAALWLFVTVRLPWLAVLVLAAGHVAPGPGVTGMPALDGPRWAQAFLRWDSGWYLRIINTGYQASNCGDPNGPCTQASISFFPAFPMTVRALAGLGLPVSVASFCLNAVCLVLALWAMHELAERLLGQGAGTRASWAMLAFPSTIFFSGGYAEALFAAASLWGVVLLIDRRAWAAAPALALAALSRPHGIVLVGALLLGLVLRRRWRELLPVALLPGLALGAYAAWQHSAFGDALAFVHARKAWMPLGSPLENITQYWAMNAGERFNPLMVLDFFVVGLLLVVALWALLRLGPEYGLYTLLLVAMPLSSGQVWGMNRAALGAFPVFLFLASLARERRRGPLLAFGLAWATLMGFFFVNGHAVG